MKVQLSLFMLCLCCGVSAQIVTVDPTFPTVNDDITIYYDATQGSGGLEGENQVYIHTGIITEAGGPGNWQNVQGDWGTDDSKVKMTNEGNNIHSISFNINNYYGLSGNEVVTELGMVFRNVDGSKEGKTSNFSDIFYPVYPAEESFIGSFISPASSNFILDLNEQLDVKIDFTENANVNVFDNGITVFSAVTETVEFSLDNLVEGNHTLKYVGEYEGEVISDSVQFVVNPGEVPVADDPDNLPFGLNRLSNNSVRLKLYAPLKEYVYVIGDFNNWSVGVQGYMNRSENGEYFWIDITDLEQNGAYSYQYIVDGEIVIADPYSTVILDDFHDQFITANVYPNLPAFPSKANSRVSYFEMNPSEFIWTDQDFQAADQTRLNIYEILTRDFVSDHSFKSIMDTLPYLKRLGINAIELMPVSEFEGNDSWGYNVSYHMALDKYYGSTTAFKALVDRAHELDIAVILDVVYNHAFSQNPYAQLYWNNNRPSAESPFFNEEPKHPFNVGYDFNHESLATKEYINTINQFWVEEYHIDGFRFDLSKGFTQTFSSDNSQFSTYDSKRISTIKGYADNLWDLNNDFYIILEHFANNDEEAELSNYGCMLWANANFNFNEATMGYTEANKSNFGHISYQTKNFNDPHAIGYMESHDEERLQYKNEQFGNSKDSYNVKDLEVGVDRIGMAAAFFYSIPGPKMIWQFGELGYDYSINHCPDGSINENCRLSPKPVRWDYAFDQDRADLNLVYSAMMNLRETEEIMHTSDFDIFVSSTMKSIYLNGEDNVLLVGNFGVEEGQIFGGFQHQGLWHEYFSGDSLIVNDDQFSFTLQPGEYRMYWDKKLDTPQLVEVDEVLGLNPKIYPNPTTGTEFYIDADFPVQRVVVRNVNGAILYEGVSSEGYLSPTTPGIYFVSVYSEGKRFTSKLVVR